MKSPISRNKRRKDKVSGLPRKTLERMLAQEESKPVEQWDAAAIAFCVDALARLDASQGQTPFEASEALKKKARVALHKSRLSFWPYVYTSVGISFGPAFSFVFWELMYDESPRLAQRVVAVIMLAFQPIMVVFLGVIAKRKIERLSKVLRALTYEEPKQTEKEV